MAMRKHAVAVTSVAASTEVTAARPYQFVELVFISGAAPVYFTTDGTTPTVAGDDTYVLAPVVGARAKVPVNKATLTVKAIAATSCVVSIEMSGR